MNTIQSLVEKVQSLPQNQGIMSVLRNESVLEAGLEVEMKPVKEFREINFRMFIDDVHRLLQPVYDKKDELEHVGLTALDVFEDYVQLQVTALVAEHYPIELTTSDNGIVIKKPEQVGKYVRSVRAMLKYDKAGVALARDADGEYTYTGKSAIENLGKNLKAAHEAAQSEARRAAAKKAGVLVDLTPKGNDTSKSSNEQKKEGNVPPPIVEPTGKADEAAPEPTVIDLAIADLMNVIALAKNSAKVEVNTGGTVEDWIVNALEGVGKKVTNMLAHNLRKQAGDALDKAAAAAKVA